MKVVLDTMIVVNKKRQCHTDCEAAFDITISNQYKLVVCEKLLWEYRLILARGQRQMCAQLDNWLYRVVPRALIEKYDDPSTHIGFGPEKDRFHMTLAAERNADFLVTMDQEVLNEMGPMRDNYGVRLTHPRNYVTTCGRAPGPELTP